MQRLRSLVVFLAVGLLIAWLSRDSGNSTGTTFLIAFVPALAATWLFEKFVLRRPTEGPWPAPIPGRPRVLLPLSMNQVTKPSTPRLRHIHI